MVDFRVRGFSGAAHQLGYGKLLLETTHTSEASAYVEIEAWQSRMHRGDVSRAELIDQRPGGPLTNLNITTQTDIPWSWKKDTR